MGIYRRPDSKYWWLWLETASPGKQRETTNIAIGETVALRKDSRALADDLYHRRMNEIAKGLHHLKQDRPEIRFAAYAAPYKTNVIAHRAGAQRETEMLANLVAFFGDDLITKITKERVARYHTHRTGRASARTINREVDLLKGMLRDAVPTYLHVSPIVGMKRLRIVPPRRRYVSKVELERLIAVCEDAEDTACLLLARNGLPRLKDLVDFQHTDRDPHHERILYVADPKNNEPNEIALSDRTLAAVNALADNGSRYFFPKFRRAENPRDWTGSVRQRLEYLCRKAGLVYGRTKNGITFHWGMRRSGATDYLRDGHHPGLVAGQGGWKKVHVLLEIYNEVTREDKLTLVGARPTRKKTRKRA